MLLKCLTQYVRKFEKFSNGYRSGKCHFSFQSQRRAMPRNVQTTILLLISHVSQVMLKALQAMLQQYVAWELPNVQARFRKDRGTRDQIVNIHWIIEKARDSRKASTSASLTILNLWLDHRKLWTILKQMGIPNHLTCLLRNLYSTQEATVRTRHQTANSLQIWKRVCPGCILSPFLFKLYAEYIMWNARLDEAQAEIKISWRNINNLRYAGDSTLWQKAKKK